ncbi:hypothetical protein QTL95_17775 [Rhizobium sp. S152]|nr:hypothetical protein [Rhizobium sp. S152]MDM9627747.1 hypothetical protein [Rhizobium sp. S152]
MNDKNTAWADESVEFLAVSFGLVVAVLTMLAAILWTALTWLLF